MAVLWLEDLGADDTAIAGGKGASLGELTTAGLPVPPGFVVSAEAYRTFLTETGIAEELFTAVDVDTNDHDALTAAAETAQSLIEAAAFPDALREEITTAYDDLGETPFVAVRSSATAEDLPDASFAGQQETYLNVGPAELIDRIKACWASLFTRRAIYYRNDRGFSHEDVNIAVVVQQMVPAEKSGVLFTSHPSTGAPEVIVEAAWGLGEAVVAGEVSPDNYVLDDAGEVREKTIADKQLMYAQDPASGATIEQPVPDAKQDKQVLTSAELEQLYELGQTVEDHYGVPQDVEWAIVDGSVYMLQSRPITTITTTEDASGLDGAPVETTAKASEDGGADDDTDGVLVTGLGASPGIASGPVQTLDSADEMGQVDAGDIIVTEMTTPDMVPAMKRADGIITDAGGMTSHAAIVSRELGVPAVVGSETATATLTDGQQVTIDGDAGTVTAGAGAPDTESAPAPETTSESRTAPVTATGVKVNVSIPEAAERAAATGADGVGLLRLEHLVLSLEKTPSRYIDDHGEEAYINELVTGLQRVADAFRPRPVRIRTLDAPTDEFRALEGGAAEPTEHNPMLGYRGIRRSVDQPTTFRAELRAFARLYEMGYDNVEIMFPLVNDAADVRAAREQLSTVGIDPDRRSWGVMIETPAAALSAEEIAQTGVDFVSFGTNDLTQYTLAVDRNNEAVADRFDELHPAVLRLIDETIATCREYDVDTGICGQAGSDPEMAQFLVERGITSVSANIDAVGDVRRTIKRTEQQLLLESARNQ